MSCAQAQAGKPAADAAGYSEVNQEELKSGQREKWLREIRRSGIQKRPEIGEDLPTS